MDLKKQYFKREIVHITHNEEPHRCTRTSRVCTAEHQRNEFGKLTLPGCSCAVCSTRIQHFRPVLPTNKAAVSTDRQQDLKTSSVQWHFGAICHFCGRCFGCKPRCQLPPSTRSRHKLTFPFRSRINIADADMLAGKYPREEQMDEIWVYCRIWVSQKK